VRQFVVGVSHPIPQVYDSDGIMVLRYGMMLGQILKAIVVHLLLKIDTSW
jgi:hypothetical protein